MKAEVSHPILMNVNIASWQTFLSERTLGMILDSFLFTGYDAMSIAKAAFQKLYGICNNWISDLPVLYRNKYSYEVSLDAIKNTRRKMEDKHFVMANFNVLHGMGVVSFTRFLSKFSLYLYFTKPVYKNRIC